MNKEEKNNLINTFINNFIQKNKHERVYFEMTSSKKRKLFVNRLNHSWDNIFEMKYLKQIDKKNDSPETVKKLLNIKENDLCYVISNNTEYDDKFFTFEEIFINVYWYGFASVIINMTADIIFLKTEQELGPATKFIGNKQH